MADNSNINLLNKAFDIIELFVNEHREMGVTEISRKLNLVKSGTFRILNTLKDRGFIFQNPQTKAYGLGLKFYFVGAEVLSKMPLCTAAKLALDPLSEYFEQNFYFAIPFLENKGEQKIIIIYTTDNKNVNNVFIHAGTIVSAHCLAIGQSILANLSDSEILTIKDSVLEKFTENTIDNWQELDKKIALTRDKNVAISENSYKDGFMDIAVAVYDSMHYPIGAIGVFGDSLKIKGLNYNSLARKMHAAAAKISDIL